MRKKIIVGLGNPGRQYYRTRHNLGFWVVDLLADKLEASWSKARCKSHVAETHYGDWCLTLAKPETFMNLSGESVQCFFRKNAFTADTLLIICDDVNLPVGKIRIRKSGSSGGHHGLESIIQSIGSDEFARIRLGVKPLEENLPEDLNHFVLERFHKGEEAVVSETARRAADAVCVLLDEGPDAAMNKYN